MLVFGAGVFTALKAVLGAVVLHTAPVSYTHLDVYKRQGITRIAINEFSKIRFLRILHIVNDVRNSRRHIPAFSHMQRHQPCSRHTITPLIQFSRLSFLALALLWFLCSGLLPGVFIQAVTDRRLFLLDQCIRLSLIHI